MLEINCIKTKSKVFINFKCVYPSVIESFLFDGEELKPTFNRDWFEVSNIPIKIETKPTTKKINGRYELKDPKFESPNIPLTVGDIDDYYEYKGLYEYVYDTIDVPSESVEFLINIIEETDSLEIIKKEHNTIPSNLIDTINHSHLICEYNKPCELTSQESYRIIRNFVKENINNKVSFISSDYDFCFTVKKKIKLAENVYYKVDVNNSIFDKRKRKPKFVEKCKETKEITIFETAPLLQGKVYNGYTMTAPFKGDNYQDLQIKIDCYLRNLIDFINEPIVECTHCKGTGIVLDPKWGVK